MWENHRHSGESRNDEQSRIASVADGALRLSEVATCPYKTERNEPVGADPCVRPSPALKATPPTPLYQGG